MRTVLWLIVWLGVSALLTLLAARLFAHDRAWALVVANGFTELIYAPAWLAAALALATRRWALLAASGVLCAWHGLQVIPLFLPKHPPAACGADLVLFSANLYAGNPRQAELIEEIAASDADVLALQEFTPAWGEALSDADFARGYRHREEHAEKRPTGSAIWSRERLVEHGTFELEGYVQTRARVKVGGGLVDLWNVHPLPPISPDLLPRHRAMMEALLERVEQLDRPFILTGDFNSSGHSAYASRLRVISEDAWELAGVGFGFTWPNSGRKAPPMRIDHVWISPELTVRSISVGLGAGSDHRPLRVVLAPRAGGRLAEGC